MTSGTYSNYYIPQAEVSHPKSGSESDFETDHQIIEPTNANPLFFWDCSNKTAAPAVENITKIHIYDFDNTIFRSPSPNTSLYLGSSLKIVSNSEFIDWWSNPLTLRNVGQGMAIERQRQWEGFWNYDILELMGLSEQDDGVLTIVMTGRKKAFFTKLIEEMLDSKNINYDALILKQGEFENTIDFKCEVITDLLNYYENVNEISIYDDRKSQLSGFQSYLNEYIEAVRHDLSYSLVPVFSQPYHLDPLIEKRLIEEELYNYNVNGQEKLELKQSLFYSAYIIDIDSRAKLIESMIKCYPTVFNEAALVSLRFQPNFIAATKHKVSLKLSIKLKENPIQWKVTHFGFDKERYAVRVESLLKDEDYPTLYTPCILPLASHGKSNDAPIEEFNQISEWHPLNSSIVISSKFSSVSMLRISQERKNNQ